MFNIFLFFGFVLNATAQSIDSLAALPAKIEESSGLIYFNNKLFTHTDSGGEAALYQIDTLTGLILRTVYVANTTNIDWEDITQDENYIYIGDIGNNLGNRTDLKIYIVSKIDFENSGSDTLNAEIINYSYENQTDFTAQNRNTNFDAEAIISFGDSLYIFSKNWINEETNVYSLPKIAGTYSAKLIGNHKVEGLITGADYDKTTENIILCGYTKFGNSFLFEMKGFTAPIWFGGSNIRKPIQPKGSVQIEAICATGFEKYFLTSEKLFSKPAVLHSFENFDSISTAINEVQEDVFVFPNPILDKIYLNRKFEKLMLYSSSGEMVLETEGDVLNVKKIAKGIYFLKCFEGNTLMKTLRVEKQ